jgi:chromate transporter
MSTHEFVIASDFSIPKLLRYFMWLGAVGFGGPAALIGYIERDLVERKRFISEEEFRHGLMLAQLAPGPLSPQLVIFLGWTRGGPLCSAMALIAFILPSFIMCVSLAIIYIKFGELSFIQATFYTIGASVIGIIIKNTFRLTKMVDRDWLCVGIMIANGVLVTIITSELPLVIIVSGLLVLLVRNPPRSSLKSMFFIAPLSEFIFGPHAQSNPKMLWDMFTLFVKAGAVVFGSGLAIVPALNSAVVEKFHWLTQRQFLDAIAIAMITPGPVVIAVVFIGFLVAGFIGSILAAVGTFLPCYFFTVIPAPYIKRYAKNPYVMAFVQGVTAAAIGALIGSIWILGKKAIIDMPTLFIAVATLTLVTKTKIPEPLVIVIAGLIGLILQLK